MTFNSITFIFLFLPIVLICFYKFTGEKARLAVLFISSMLFYAWDNPKYVILLAASIVFNYITALEINEWRKADKPLYSKIAMITGVAINLLLLIFYKYTGFIAGIFGQTVQKIYIPLGISFYTFSVISYILDIYNGKAEFEVNPTSFITYVSFFPKVIQGPIVQYSEMAEKIKNPRVNKKNLYSGFQLFLIGLFKKILIADRLGLAFSQIYGTENIASATAWIATILFSFQLYFDFSGYSDMAIGLARMFGFKFDKNFNYPYISEGCSDFWRRWHISLGKWFRTYVYIPLGGNRCSTMRQIFNLAVVWLLTGIWHGASWNFVIWGIYSGAWVIFDKFVVEKYAKSIPKILRIILTVLVVWIGWIFFFTSSLSQSVYWIKLIFGMSEFGFWNAATSYYFMTNIVLILISILFCAPFVGEFFENLFIGTVKNGEIVVIAVYFVLFIFSIAGIISNTYSAFLYMQF